MAAEQLPLAAETLARLLQEQLGSRSLLEETEDWKEEP